MELEDAIALCLSLPHVTEKMPFGPDVIVYQVAGKMFALTNPDEYPARMNLKCDPERSLELRDAYAAIVPGYHMNKRHWNTVQLSGVPSSLVAQLIQHSYDLVLAGLTKSQRPQDS